MDVVQLIEKILEKKAKINFLPMQPGDVLESFADIKHSQDKLGFSPKTSISEGIPKFIEWFKYYYD